MVRREHELLRARQLAVCRIKRCLVLSDDGGRGGSFGLALRDETFGGVDVDDGALQLCFRLTRLGLQLLGVHVGEHLAGGDEIALIDEDF